MSLADGIVKRHRVASSCIGVSGKCQNAFARAGAGTAMQVPAVTGVSTKDGYAYAAYRVRIGF
jgi:hypothetical protein